MRVPGAPALRLSGLTKSYLVILAGPTASVFSSVNGLPAPWEQLTRVDPVFYLVQAVRHGFLGSSDVRPALTPAVTGALAAAMVLLGARLSATGHRLKA